MENYNYSQRSTSRVSYDTYSNKASVSKVSLALNLEGPADCEKKL